MIRIKNKILQCLHDFNIKEPAQFHPLLYIQNYIKKNVKIVKIEINYLKQKGLVEEKIINFVPSYRITAEGIDTITTSKFSIFLIIVKKLWWVIAILIPLVYFYINTYFRHKNV